MNDICVITAELDCYKTLGLHKLIDNVYQDNISNKNKVNFFYIIKGNPKNHSSVSSSNFKYKASYLNFSNLNHILNANLVIIDGFRFPDRLITNLRKLSNKETIYIQHGRYTKIKRNYFSKHVRMKFIGYLSLLIRLFLKKPLKTFIAASQRKTFIEKGFLYTPISYWQQYHFERKIIFKKIINIPDSDLSKFNLSKTIENNKILYLAQSIYEDGRCNLKTIKNFYDKILNYSITNNLNLSVRPHPRSNLELLKKYFNKEQLLSTNSFELSNPLFVITHHSALAVFFLENNIPTFFYRINNEDFPKGLIEYDNSFIIKSFKKINIKKLKKLIKKRKETAKKLNESYFDIFKDNIL